MSYRFNIAEPVGENVRRIATEEIKTAISHLKNTRSKDREEDIHEARKAIKRLRALLRLVRPELGQWFRRENTALRDIGHSLSDLRDSSIVLETFDSLPADGTHRKELQPARRGLQEQKKAKEETTDLEQTLAKAAGALQEVSERVDQWPLNSDGFEAIAEGLRAEYRDGRKAMPEALKSNDSLIFHEWRKRAKCQLFHMRLLKNVVPEPLRHEEKELHELETALGDDHNLLILREHLEAHPKAFGGKKLVQRSLQLIKQRESELRAKAEALGQEVYAHKPKEFVELLRAEWEKASNGSVRRRRIRKTAA